MFKFPYQLDQPIINTRLTSILNRSIILGFLVDSGATHSVISESIAMSLGVTYNSMDSKEQELHAFDGSIKKAKKTYMYLTLGKINIRMPILVTQSLTEPILGQKGLFDCFDILFQKSKQRFQLIPASL